MKAIHFLQNATKSVPEKLILFWWNNYKNDKANNILDACELFILRSMIALRSRLLQLSPSIIFSKSLTRSCNEKLNDKNKYDINNTEYYVFPFLNGKKKQA